MQYVIGYNIAHDLSYNVVLFGLKRFIRPLKISEKSTNSNYTRCQSIDVPNDKKTPANIKHHLSSRHVMPRPWAGRHHPIQYLIETKSNPSPHNYQVTADVKLRTEKKERHLQTYIMPAPHVPSSVWVAASS